MNLCPTGYTCIIDTCIPKAVQSTFTGDPGTSLITASALASPPTPTTTDSEENLLLSSCTICSNGNEATANVNITALVMMMMMMMMSTGAIQTTLFEFLTQLLTEPRTGADTTFIGPHSTTTKDSGAKAVVARHLSFACVTSITGGNTLDLL